MTYQGKLNALLKQCNDTADYFCYCAEQFYRQKIGFVDAKIVYEYKIAKTAKERAIHEYELLKQHSNN